MFVSCHGIVKSDGIVSWQEAAFQAITVNPKQPSKPCFREGATTLSTTGGGVCLGGSGTSPPHLVRPFGRKVSLTIVSPFQETVSRGVGDDTDAPCALSVQTFA